MGQGDPVLASLVLANLQFSVVVHCLDALDHAFALHRLKLGQAGNGLGTGPVPLFNQVMGCRLGHWPCGVRRRSVYMLVSGYVIYPKHSRPSESMASHSRPLIVWGRHLRHLNLSHTGLTNAGLRRMASLLPALSRLTVAHTWVNAEGAEVLARVLAQTKSRT